MEQLTFRQDPTDKLHKFLISGLFQGFSKKDVFSVSTTFVPNTVTMSPTRLPAHRGEGYRITIPTSHMGEEASDS